MKKIKIGLFSAKRFPKKLKISPLNGTGFWSLNETFQYLPMMNLCFKTSEMPISIISVPIGFITNFASVPRIFRNIVQQWGDHGKAAVIHDYLYSSGNFYNLTRKEADLVFLEAMKYSKVPFLKRQLLYRLVRLFGGSHFKKED